MTVPTATYRLQLREGMTFHTAAGLVPYLAGLGVSHLYLSPIFEAVKGSTHGYDVIDCHRLDPVLGGDAAFARLTVALATHGLGLIVDFVPNHMAATPQNSWWRDVLEWGSESAYAHHFDVDWTAPRLILPLLADLYGHALLSGDIGLSLDHRNGELGFTIGELTLPASPKSYAEVLSGIDDQPFADLAQDFSATTPESVTFLKRALARLTAEPVRRAALDQHLQDIVADRDALHKFHERQNWRLTHWRAAREALTYRRFFEISDLVGLRVERPDVFRDVHKGLFELVDQRKISGIRLDHIDGLADPTSYLDRLQAALGNRAPVLLIVEKILGPGEALPTEWPVVGTTGYEFAKAVTDVLVDTDGEADMTAAYFAFIGHSVDYDALVLDAKRRVFAHNLAGELSWLAAMAHTLAQQDLAARDLGADTLRVAIVELVAALCVYRTYVDCRGPSQNDRHIIAAAMAKAKANGMVEHEEAFDFIAQLLLDPSAPEDRVIASNFLTRFQQTTGPVMAKALEDTTFYRYNRFIALNEVGGEPQHFGAPTDAFHQAMSERAMQQPAGLNATSTHDTKRGEDARARLCVLSEVPLEWAEHVKRWSGLLANSMTEASITSYPDPNTEWLFYQALLGAWPMDLELADRADLRDRVALFMLKAIRETKVHTTWTAPNQDYERTIEEFTRCALDLDRSRLFLDDFHSAVQPLLVAGALNSFSQALVKLTAPGVPDIYQGAESWNLSLVDPDNRRPVDFERLARQLSEAASVIPSQICLEWRSGLPKISIIARGLALRSKHARLCAEGRYVPLTLSGPQAGRALAFARVLGDQAMIAVVPRRTHALLDGAPVPHIPSERWRETSAALPEALAKLDWYDWLAEAPFSASGLIELETALARFPVALLATQPKAGGPG